MQYDLSAMTPATRAVFDALIALGKGNVHELSEQSGKARSTTDKAIRALSEAGLITAVGTDTDAAEGTPTRWTLAEGVAAEAQQHDFSTEDTAGTDEDYSDEPADPSEDADDSADEQDDDGIDTTEDDGDTAEDRNDEANEFDEESDPAADDEDEPDDDGDEQDEADPAADEDDEDEEDEDDRRPVAVVQPTRPGDRKVMTIKMVLSEHGDDGATMMEIVAESGIGDATVSRLLTAMEQADAARRLPGSPRRWIAGPTKASEVDPNPEPPRCPLCFQLIKGLSESPEAVSLVLPLVRPDGTVHVVAEDGTVHPVTLPRRTPIRTPGTATVALRRNDLTVNGDGSQPFAKGELEKLTLAVLAAGPGRTMTPQEIATTISAQLGGRAVSSGAVRNNCTKAAAKGDIFMVSEAPLSFAYPAQAGGSDTDESGTTDEQS